MSIKNEYLEEAVSMLPDAYEWPYDRIHIPVLRKEAIETRIANHDCIGDPMINSPYIVLEFVKNEFGGWCSKP